MKILIVLVLCQLCLKVSGFDVIRNLFKEIDYLTDPCTNFYRHACPKGKGSYAIVDEYSSLKWKLEAEQKDRIWDNLEIKKFLDNALIAEVPEAHLYIYSLFKDGCDQGLDNEKLLDYIEKTAFGPNGCTDRCLSFLSLDKNCTRAGFDLMKRLAPSNVAFRKFASFTEPLKKKLAKIMVNIRGTNIIIDAGLEEGMEVVNDLVNRVVYKVIEWIEQTPWVVNNQLVDQIIDTVNKVYLNKNYGLYLRNYLNSLLSSEQSYLKCLADLGGSEEFKYFCFMYASDSMEPVDLTEHFFNNFNAHIIHPVTEFSFYYYHMAQNINEYAANLGSVGTTVGHEVSHTLIENAAFPEIIQYFSNNSMQCIQGQYQKTCDEFKEHSCNVSNSQIDENGADILGFQLAYALFEEAYHGRLHEKYIEIRGKPITFQQLFFYAFAFNGCDKRSSAVWDMFHSAENVRVNAVSQHPAFQEAFQCAQGSPMMRSATEQCIIFGDGAPETRK